MAFGIRSRAALSLLIATGLVAGVQGTSSPAQESRTATYSCCCSGECHCTADCCNHGPEKTRPGEPPRLRDGAGPPVWRDAERCGARLVTLQRAPGPTTTLRARTWRHPAVDSDGQRRRLYAPRVAASSTSYLAGPSPRAPPAA
jgi:hypothetical protein